MLTSASVCRVSCAARLAGQSLEELDDEVNASALSRAAQKLLLKLGFVGILLFAAVWPARCNWSTRV